MRRSSTARVLRIAVSGLPGGGEARQGQLAMALAVEAAISRDRHLIVQAGTGTGKSLAYLVPSILHVASGTAKRPVVVATATKALQDQIAGKDAPFLSRALRRPIRQAVLKGRANYLCRQKATEVLAVRDDPGRLSLTGYEDDGPDGPTQPDGPTGPPLFDEVRRILAWSATSATGDRAELEFEPTSKAWELVSVGAHECPGARSCPSGDTCFAEVARERAEQADVVIVNTHLYGAHLSSEAGVLPDHDVVVFDEAHELEDIFAASLGTALNPRRLRSLARLVRHLAGKSGAEVADNLWSAASGLSEVAAAAVSTRVTGESEELIATLELAAERVRRVSEKLRWSQSTLSLAGHAALSDPLRARALQLASSLSEDLSAFLGMGSDQVAWVEGPQRSPTLKLAPVEVGPMLSQVLWGNVTAILTSATIPAGLAGRLGLAPGEAYELDVGSPFPFESSALLYCAAHLPDRRRPQTDDLAHEELVRLIEAAGGRTLALFTSWRAMAAAADSVRGQIPFRVLTQSDLPKPALIESFSNDETACLFATMGFWQGVDVPGSTLSLVVIDRIPFPRPDDPLLQARRERAGPAAFRTVDLPRAAALMAQGAGRLIRSCRDRGVVAVLDPRLARASYRWDLVLAMPPMTRTRHFVDVTAFFARTRDRGPLPDLEVAQ